VGHQPGRYRVELEIGKLPLSPGEYSLNLFLAAPADSPNGARVGLDTRSWTYGTGVVLQVEGVPTAGVAPLALRWIEEPA
jgi:hypothetical protein